MTDNLPTALALVQTKLPTIVKHQTAVVKSEKATFSYEYADLADVSEQILPLLGDAGLAWICRPTYNAEGKFVLSYSLVHISGEREDGQYPLPNSGTPQAMGAAISYARRYCLCAVTGAAPKGDDDDAASVPKATTAQRQSRPRPAPAATAAPSQRTAQRARVDGPALPGDDEPAEPPSDLISARQRGMVLALFDKAGVSERGERLDISRRIIGRGDLASANDLTKGETSRLIEWLTAAEKDGFTNALADLLAASEGGDG